MTDNYDWNDEAVLDYVKKCLDSFKEKIQKMSRVSDLENLRDTLMLFKGLTPDNVDTVDLSIANFADLYVKSDVIYVKMINAEIHRRLSIKQ